MITPGHLKPVVVFLLLILFSLLKPSLSEASSANRAWGDGHDRTYVNVPVRSTRTVVPRLPHHVRKFWYGGRPYYRHGNICYARVRGGWEVVQLRGYWGR